LVRRKSARKDAKLKKGLGGGRWDWTPRARGGGGTQEASLSRKTVTKKFKAGEVGLTHTLNRPPGGYRRTSGGGRLTAREKKREKAFKGSEKNGLRLEKRRQEETNKPLCGGEKQNGNQKVSNN